MRPHILGLLLALALTSCACSAEDDSAARRAPAEVAKRPCVNLNTATAEELTVLPGVGEVTARKIVEYRERHGPFLRPQEIIILDGFSEKKYRAIADLICVGESDR